MKTSSGSGMAGMVMVGFVLVGALTLGVALAPDVDAGNGGVVDNEENGSSGVDPSPTPDFDED